MSIIDDVTELRTRLEEIEAEKAAGIRGEGGSGLPADVYAPAPNLVMSPTEPAYLAGCRLAKRDVEPTRPDQQLTWSIESRAEMLRSQVRLYTRLRAECIQALTDTEARIAVLKGKE